MENYIVLTIEGASLEDSNQLKELAMSNFGALGIEDYSIDEATIDELLGEKAFSGGNITEDLIADLEVALINLNKFAIYFDKIDDANKFKNQAALISNQIKISFEEKKTEDWNENWKKNYQTINVTDDLAIIPSWEKSEHYNSNSSLYIYPGRGFGTGTHETTFQCLKIFMEMFRNKKFKNCLDYGCGSGILGLNFHRLNRNSLSVLYDIDEQALENSIQNIEVNDFSKSNFEITSNKNDFKNRKFEIVFANILLSILIEEKSSILNSLEKEGFLIISGLLEGQGKELLMEFNEGLKLLEHRKTNGWEAILFQKL
jgi:ribosomal protein L11 methyltransferase